MNYPVLQYWVLLINTVQLNSKLITGFSESYSWDRF